VLLIIYITMSTKEYLNSLFQRLKFFFLDRHLSNLRICRPSFMILDPTRLTLTCLWVNSPTCWENDLHFPSLTVGPTCLYSNPFSFVGSHFSCYTLCLLKREGDFGPLTERGVCERRKRRRRKAAVSFLELPSRFRQVLRSTSICGPIELKFCGDVHDT
jgi:hypothetical protein